MKKTLKRIIALVIAVAVVSGVTLISVADSKETEFFSVVDSYAEKAGTFTFTSASRIFVVSENEPSDELLQTATLIQKQYQDTDVFKDEKIDIVWGPESYIRSGDIALKVNASASVGDEGYILDVTDKAIVTAKDMRGLIYGSNMILKCMRYLNSESMNGFTASDTPDTKQRAVMLDTGRKYYSANWIKNFIRQLSWMGYNAIELHFSEDGGFRADFWDSAYYTDNFSPENDFSWLCGSKVQSWVRKETYADYTQDPDAGKYLSTKELVEILEVAKEYHIDVIPSFDSPAHMDYITWKFEQNYKSNTSYSFTYDGTTYKASSTNGCINYTGRTGAASPTWPYYTTIDITDGTMARAFVFALYEDIADFFKEYAGSTDFSIGADEVNLSSSYSPKWSYSAFPGYVNELNRMLNAKGYTCRIFNDFIGSTTYNKSGNKAVYSFDDNIEIMYWNSNFNPTSGSTTETVWPAEFFWENNGTYGDGGRTLYNCIQTNTYYVLRVSGDNLNTDYENMDARNPENHNWTFYHSNESDIYNEWYPANVAERGVKSETVKDIPANQLGGAYFLIWNDYAALNTEAEVWNGVDDNTPNKGSQTYHYSLFNRMWSNSIKMWNSDINSAVDYSDFANIRNSYGFFPLYVACSAPATTVKVNAIKKAYLSDHSELEAAVKTKISNEDGLYTAESYSAYETAYNNAVAVNNNYGATAEEISTALEQLNNAKNNLEEVVIINKSELQAAVDGAVTEKGDYTNETWDVYIDALNAAKAVLDDENATQEQIDSALAQFSEAKSNLAVYKEGDTRIFGVKRLTEYTPLGKKAGFIVYTSTDALDVTVSLDGNPVKLTKKINNVQTLSGVEMGVWMVDFVPEEIGTFEYTVTVNGTVSQNVSVTVK